MPSGGSLCMLECVDVSTECFLSLSLSRSPCGHPAPCLQKCRICVSCIARVCCSVSPCVDCEFVELELAPVPVSCALCSAWSCGGSPYSRCPRGSVRKNVVPSEWLICALIFCGFLRVGHLGILHL